MKKLYIILLLLVCMMTSVFAAIDSETTASVIDNTVSLDLTLLTLVVLTLIISFATVSNNVIVGIIGGLGVIIQGLYFMLDSLFLGLITLIAGLMIALYFAIKQTD